jgi:hypothetical protein
MKCINRGAAARGDDRFILSVQSVLIALAALWLGASNVAQALTADEIVAQHVNARGGVERLQALKTLKRTGRLVIPGFNGELTVTEYKARPNEYRVEYTLQGLTAVQAWDGHEAWQIQPFQGRKDPERLSADQAKPLANSADIDFPFVDYQAKGSKLSFLGTEDVDGTPAYKLRLQLASGDEIVYFIDPDSWMLIRDIQKQQIRGAEQITENDYGEYEQVEGVWVPMTEASGSKGSDPSQKQQTLFDKAEGNVDIDSSIFSFPAAK